MVKLSEIPLYFAASLSLMVLRESIIPATAQPPIHVAHYTHRLVWTALPDGRHMQLVEPFGFQESDGTDWPVPVGAVTDGASIPRFMWTIIGGPYEGKYRDAAVIHDYYCDVRTRPWRVVDRMFYNGMLTSKVDERLAKIMYAAVVYGGPHWDDQTVMNTNTLLVQTTVRGPLGTRKTVTKTIPVSPGVKFRPIQKLIEDRNPTLDGIDKAVADAWRR